MLKRSLLAVLLVTLLVLAGCGGEEEPTPTPTPLATFTPTPAPTEIPTEAAPAPVASALPGDATPAATEEAADGAAPAEAAPEGATPGPGAGEEVFAPAVLAPESPLAAPESPLPAPEQPVAGATPAQPLPPVTGAWQLQTIRAASSMSETAAPPGFQLAFSPTGVLRVMADCRTGRGEYTRRPEGALTLNAAYADVRCAPDSLADPFTGALAEVTSYRFVDDRLVLSYGTQGGEMGLARVSPMAAFGAPFLSWSSLKNSTFLVPGAPAGDGQAPLIDGEFRTRATPPPAAEGAAPVTDTAAADFVVSLATMHTYGDLETPTPEPTPVIPPPADATPTPTPEPEVSADSVVVLVVNDGAVAQSYLAPVLNGGGLAIPLTLEPLGENVYVRELRWDGTQLTVDFDQGTEGKRRVYTFETNRFVQVSEEGLPPQSPRGRLDLPTQNVVFAPAAADPGNAEATLTGAIETGVVHPYRLAAQAGQQVTVTLQSPYDNVWLSLYGTSDRTVLRSIRSETSSWAGVVPSTQDYIASAVAAGSASPYTLTIQLAGVGEGLAQTQTTTAATGAGSTVHLVFDGAPSAAVLDVLGRNNATADFFVTGEQAAQAAEGLAAAAAAGHGRGIVAGPIPALTSSGRDALFTGVSTVRQSLGGQALRCLRPPYAATDGYTRAAAAELGYDILLWDLDAGTAPAEAIAAQVFPGAVVRFADPGDGGAAAAATLEGLLPLLAQQGYTVRAACQ